ncbi:cytidine deaminase [Pectinatus brassicae]|uniref:Cytidine deaminase n=1 Tax=Pectinatus brassicae TaxID=862415 RepID=A0A840UET2_9FIRM|nr:cytidine deaminase [Pectinatus brassicae]MBB5336231.1 cytidine deaminase [Pectinatus brassicae]
MLEEKLLEAAKNARLLSYSPYSKFKVGAAVLTKNGKIYSGCNIENASYGITNCAERTAIFKAVSEGERDLTALVVVADTEGPVSPCGACRQVIAEFKIDTVIMANLHNEIKTVTWQELLPYSFSDADMK